MRLLRALLNLILAVVTLCAICVVMVVGWGMIATRSRENMGLDFVSGNATPQEDTDLGEWLWLDGEPIHYMTWGAGEDDPFHGNWVVLVHGAQIEGGQTWHQLAPQIARGGLRVMAVDLAGMGRSTRQVSAEDTAARSQAETLAIVLNELHIQQANVVANGWGSAVALHLAYEQPQFVNQLVLVSPSLEQPWPSQAIKLAGLPYAGRSVAWFLHGGSPYDQWQQREAFGELENLPPNYWADVGQYLLIEDTTAALTTAMSAESDPFPRAILGRVQQPVEIVVGELAPDEQIAAADTLDQELVSSSRHTVPDAGPELHIERAPYLGQHLLDLFR